MITRHFYEVEEVVAALHWSMLLGRTKEAAFWSQELLDSDLLDILQEEIQKIWLWFFGIGCLSALPDLENEEILLTVCGLCRLPKERRDRSVLALLLLGLETKQPDRVSYFPKLESLFQELQCSQLEQTFLAAVYQGKTRLAFALSRPLWQISPQRVYTLLQKIQIVKHNSLEVAESLTLLELWETPKWAVRACAIAAVCLDKKRLLQSLQPLNRSLPAEIQTSLSEWKDLLGRRKRRAFKIPIECLYKRTQRGCLSNKETNLSNLYRLNHHSLEEQGCPSWKRILEEEVPWLDDDRHEEFYDTYFPDDIPDEWSRADQEKSHGYGCLINNETPNEGKYRDRWFRNLPTRAYWFLNKDLQKNTAEDLESDYEKPWHQVVSTWCLTPVKKRLLVLDSVL